MYLHLETVASAHYVLQWSVPVLVLLHSKCPPCGLCDCGLLVSAHVFFSFSDINAAPFSGPAPAAIRPSPPAAPLAVLAMKRMLL